MKKQPILCTQCAGPLKVVGTEDHAKCRYCGTQLRLHRQDGEVIAEALGELRRIAAEAKDRDQRREVMGELKKLKSRWMAERRDYLSVDRHTGVRMEPTEGAGAFVLVIGVIVALLAFVGLNDDGNILSASLFAGAVLLIASLIGFHLIHDARYFANRRRVYVRKRRAILNRLHEDLADT